MAQRNAVKWVVVGLIVAATATMPLMASAHGRDHDGWRGDRGYSGYYRHHRHWDHGHWLAGAVVTGAVAGLVGSVLAPPVYYRPARVIYAQPPVVYGPPTVIYRSAPVVTRTVIYENRYPVRYVHGDDDDD